jgi:hypothetical protein
MLDVVASMTLIAAALTLIYKNVFSQPGAGQPELEVPVEPLTIQGVLILGAPAA